MSQRRMTSLEVINTDAFLDMPQSSQLLYFHLNARADDDGFVSNPRSLMRNCGAQGDDLKLLIAKKFLINFEDGVCIIKHWRINNYIRKDIYKETRYLDHKQTLFIRPNGAYTLSDDNRAVPVPDGHFQLETIKPKNRSTEPYNYVHEASTERALRLGKDRLDIEAKASEEKDDISIELIDDDGNPLVKRKGIKKPVAKRTDLFSMDKAIAECLASKLKTKKIVGSYFKERGWEFENWDQFETALARELKPAASLKGYTGPQIKKAIDYCRSEWGDSWTLETLSKWINEANKNG